MSGRGLHQRLTELMSVALIVVGIALLVRTLTSGGGALATGILLGALFVAAGLGRLWVARRPG